MRVAVGLRVIEAVKVGDGEGVGVGEQAAIKRRKRITDSLILQT